MHKQKGVAAGSSASDGKKRKRAKEGVGGSGSAFGDGDEFRGVRNGGLFVVEIKKYIGANCDFYKTVHMKKLAAALLYDLAQFYADSNYPEEGLNIHQVVVLIQKKDPALAHPEFPGRVFLDNFVKEHPLKHPREDWEKLTKKEFRALKDEMAALAPECFLKLKQTITSPQGRQRNDVVGIPPCLPAAEDDVVQGMTKEIQDLKDKDVENAAKIASLEKGKKEDAATIASLEKGKKEDAATIASLENGKKEDAATIASLEKGKKEDAATIAAYKEASQSRALDNWWSVYD